MYTQLQLKTIRSNYKQLTQTNYVSDALVNTLAKYGITITKLYDVWVINYKNEPMEHSPCLRHIITASLSYAVCADRNGKKVNKKQSRLVSQSDVVRVFNLDK